MRLPTAVAACLLAWAAASAPGEEIALAAAADPRGALVVTATLSGVDSPRLLRSLAEGLETAVTFELRLYRRAVGLRSLLGDRLVAQADLTRRASVDLIDGRYILLDESGQTRLHTVAEDFVRDFLSLRAFRPSWPVEAGGYLVARARVEYVRLDPPLHIVALFRSTAAVTEWRRVDVAGAEGPRK